MTIRELRKSKGWTLKILSEKSGVSIRAIQKLEYGETNPGNTTAKVILALADALEIDPHELVK